MAIEIECTHCHVLMTSWAAPGSPVRYWQCPFCGRTHSSLYSEVFDRGAGARRVGASAVPAASAAPAPQATPEQVRWNSLKARAARWFERLELEQEQAPAARDGAGRPGDAGGAGTHARSR